MERSFSFRRSVSIAIRSLKVAGGGLLTLAISAVLIAFRILLCDDTDIIWDHPSMFPEVVAMAYEPSSGSDWGILWDMFFLVVPMMVYITIYVPKLWDEYDGDEYGRYRVSNLPLCRPVAHEPPVLEWGYEEYSITREAPPAMRSRTSTLRGFPCVRPPAQPVNEASKAMTEFDEGWFLPDDRAAT